MGRTKVLIVDDSPLHRMLTRSSLAEENYELAEASNGAEALQLTRTLKPDLVIADILMPVMDGYEFLRRLRSDADLSNTKVIFYTGTFSEADEAELAKSGGVLFHLLKPADPADLREAVRSALAHADTAPASVSSAYEQEHLRVLTNKLSKKVEQLEKANRHLEMEIQKRIRAEAEAVESRNFFEALANSIPQIAWVTQGDGTVLYVNQRWIDFIGYGPKTLLPQDWAKFLHPDEHTSFLKRAAESLMTRKEMNFQTRILRRKDHVYVPHLVRSIAVVREDGNETLWFGTCTDITMQKAYEESLIALKEQAEDLSRAKSEFLANISHELRTPLNSIVGFGELLKFETDAGLREEALDRIESNARRLTSVLSDIISISELEANKAQARMDLFSLENFLSQLKENVDSRARAKGLHFVVEKKTAREKLKSYPDILRRILDHLLDNAVKFTPAGKIRLRTEIKPPEIEFEIQDTGIGIADHERPLLFKSFSQIDGSSTRAFGGLGLGLVLAKKMAEAIEGEVELVSSASGGGSCFRVKAPVEVVEDEK